jgi:hypothetical protein
MLRASQYNSTIRSPFAHSQSLPSLITAIQRYQFYKRMEQQQQNELLQPALQQIQQLQEQNLQLQQQVQQLLSLQQQVQQLQQ